MLLPMIHNRTQKQIDKYQQSNEVHPQTQEFGLGIHVFKIQSTKTIDTNPHKQKKVSRNVQNPIVQHPTAQAFKRTPILPSLSVDKKAKTGGLNDTFKERKATIQKKKLVIPSDSIKQFEERPRQIEKKVSNAQQTNKGHILQQANPVSTEKTIVQRHYRTSMNEIVDFYERFEERQTENLKEIRRLKKAKDINNEQQLSRELNFKQNKIQMVLDMVNKLNLPYYETEDLYDEFSLTNYMDGGCKFKFEDIQPDFQY